MYDKTYFNKIASLLEAMQSKKPLDPVGQEDKDIDNDGDHDKSDKYLHKRRKTIAKAIMKKEDVSLDETTRLLAKHGDVEVHHQNGIISVKKNGKEVANGEFDRGSDLFFISHRSFGKGQRAFDTSTQIAKHFSMMKEACECDDDDDEEEDMMMKKGKKKSSKLEKMDEKAPPGAKYERMVKHIKKGYSKDGLTDKEKSIAYATAWKAKGKANEEVEQMNEKFVIHKGKHEPGTKSSLGGQTLYGVTVKDVYTNKKEAQAHADKINAGRGYKPGDEKNSLYGGVLYQVSPAKSMKEEAEQIDEISKGTAIRAAGVAGSNDDLRTTSIINRIHKKFGSKASDDAEAHAKAQYYGRDGKSRGTDPLNSVLDRPSQMRKTKAGKINRQDQKALASAIKGRMKMHGGKSPLPEEVEQMNEISNKTKRAYMGSAVADLTSRSLQHGAMSGKKRYKGSDLAKYQGRKIMNRQMGIARVSDALVKKEEVEQIDELSSKTLTSYTSKASKDAANKAASSVWKSAGPSPDDKGSKKDFDKARSRIKGVDLALKKLSRKPYKAESREWGVGEVIPGTATVVESEDGQKFITHVDVMFSHGIEFDVPVSQITISEAEASREKYIKGATKPEGLMDKESEGSKKFAAMHDYGKAKVVYDDEAGHTDATDAGRVTKQAPPHRGEKRVGHLKPEKLKEPK